MLVEAVLVAILNSVALMILGIPYAILIGVIGALLNVIPYIGGVVAVALPMLLALATKQPIDALYVLIAYLMVQFIDNNLFVPKIVASKVKINALVSIIVVLVGNAALGRAGHVSFHSDNSHRQSDIRPHRSTGAIRILAGR